MWKTALPTDLVLQKYHHVVEDCVIIVYALRRRPEVLIKVLFCHIWERFLKYLPPTSLAFLHGTTITDSFSDSTHITGYSRADVWVPYCCICLINNTWEVGKVYVGSLTSQTSIKSLKHEFKVFIYIYLLTWQSASAHICDDTLICFSCLEFLFRNWKTIDLWICLLESDPKNTDHLIKMSGLKHKQDSVKKLH